ncbi:MAG: hypothetical protein ACT4OX_10820 [Actinomycetota bacterium]
MQLLEQHGLVRRVTAPDGSIVYAPLGDLAARIEHGSPIRPRMGDATLEEIAFTEGPDGTIVSASIIVRGTPSASDTPPPPDADTPSYPGVAAADRFAAEEVESAIRRATGTPPAEPPAPPPAAPPDGSIVEELGREFWVDEMLSSATPGEIRTTRSPQPADGAPARPRSHFAQAADVLLRGTHSTLEEQRDLALAIEYAGRRFVHERSSISGGPGLASEPEGASNEAIDALRGAAAEVCRGLDVPAEAHEAMVNAMLDEVARHFARDLLK